MQIVRGRSRIVALSSSRNAFYDRAKKRPSLPTKVLHRDEQKATPTTHKLARPSPIQVLTAPDAPFNLRHPTTSRAFNALGTTQAYITHLYTEFSIHTIVCLNTANTKYPALLIMLNVHKHTYSVCGTTIRLRAKYTLTD